LCSHFDGTVLVGCARPGLQVLEAADREVILGGETIGCGVPLDRCRQPHETDADRWDYLFTERDTTRGHAVEVHHAASSEVEKMIAKKKWATALLASECPHLQVVAWAWIASPPNGEILFSRGGPPALRLAQEGIDFPARRIFLP
jgi:hypothetical protein